MAQSDIERELYGGKYLTVGPIPDALVATTDTEAVIAVIQVPENLELERVVVGVLTSTGAGDGITIRVREASLTGRVLGSVALVTAGAGPEGACGIKVSEQLDACELIVVTSKLLAAGDDFTGVIVTLVVEPLKS